MEFQKDEIRAGVVIVICLAILGLFIFKIGDIQLFKSTYKAKVAFAIANGLEKESSVMFAGVPVGKIIDVKILSDKELVRPQDPRVVFTVEVDKSANIKKDSIASIKTMGLMGEKYIEVLPGSPESPTLAPGDVLLGEAPFD